MENWQYEAVQLWSLLRPASVLWPVNQPGSIPPNGVASNRPWLNSMPIIKSEEGPPCPAFFLRIASGQARDKIDPKRKHNGHCARPRKHHSLHFCMLDSFFALVDGIISPTRYMAQPVVAAGGTAKMYNVYGKQKQLLFRKNVPLPLCSIFFLISSRI